MTTFAGQKQEHSAIHAVALGDSGKEPVSARLARVCVWTVLAPLSAALALYLPVRIMASLAGLF